MRSSSDLVFGCNLLFYCLLLIHYFILIDWPTSIFQELLLSILDQEFYGLWTCNVSSIISCSWVFHLSYRLNKATHILFYWQCLQTEWIDVPCLIWLLNASEKQCLFLMSMVSSPFWFSRRTNIHYFCDDFHLWWHFSGHICDYTSVTRTVKVLISTLTLYGSKESPEKHSCKWFHMSNVWELSINYFLSWFWGCFHFF